MNSELLLSSENQSKSIYLSAEMKTEITDLKNPSIRLAFP